MNPLTHDNPTGKGPKLEAHGFDLHRAYRAMIREILRRQLLKRAAPPAGKEESRG